MGKGFAAFGLSLLLLLSSSLSVSGISQEKLTYAESIAPELKELGMFVGTDKGFELEREASRVEAVTMLVRLLGKETEAKNGRWEHPFTDVPLWADKIVGYAYNHSLTSGVTSNKFGSTDTVSSAQYVTFVLRALGYSDSKEITDFTWDNPFDLATRIGLIKNGEYQKDSEFLRADVAIISYNALSQALKGKQEKLKDILSKASQETEAGSGDSRNAGMFRTVDSKLVVVNKNVDYDINLGNLNNMLFNTYGLRYKPELTKDGYNGNAAMFVYDEANNRYGLQVTAWRQSYDSDIVENNVLNAILETFYFMSGDKEVAVGIWKWVDSLSINGNADTNDFGFTDVGTLPKGGTVKMNGIEIDIIVGDKSTTVWFK